MKHKWLLFVGYTVIAIGFCGVQFWKYANSFETVTPYEHAFQMQEPSETIFLDLNEATASQLSKLPNVSRPLADKIVAYRKELGGFSTIRQLLAIPEMPESLYLALEEYIYLTPRTETTASPIPTETISTISIETETTEIPLLNLNTATAEELCLLPEIGEVTAAAIVAYRTQNGSFFNKLQLLEITGIGDAAYQAIEPYLYVENELPMPDTTPPVVETPETQVEIIEPTECFRINLNTASLEDLMTLPDCDESLAQEILTLRDGIHVFSNILEICYAPSMTPDLYEKWELYLAIDDDGNTEKPAS